MHISKTYHEVPADALVRLGVIDIMRTPADGTNRNTHIQWKRATLAVAASFDDWPDCRKPHHQIVVKNINGQGHSQGFSADELPCGAIRVATVSGGHPEGCATLNAEQSATFKRLINASIAADPGGKGMRNKVINALPSIKQVIITFVVCLLVGVIVAGFHPMALVMLGTGTGALALVTFRNYNTM